MYNLATLSLSDLFEINPAVRDLGEGAQNIEEVAQRVVRYFYESLIDTQSGRPACALVRFYKTHPYATLGKDLQGVARGMLQQSSPDPQMKCFTLMASAGDEPAWNSRQQSKGHQAIPLSSAKMVERLPMVAQLVKQLGLEIPQIVQPDPQLLPDLEQRTYNVFFVPDALGSPYIPAQQEFVGPKKIRSVLGFGSMLPSGNIFAIILFAKVALRQETANLFRDMALTVKIPLVGLDYQGKIFEAG